MLLKKELDYGPYLERATLGSNRLYSDCWATQQALSLRHLEPVPLGAMGV